MAWVSGAGASVAAVAVSSDTISDVTAGGAFTSLSAGFLNAQFLPSVSCGVSIPPRLPQVGLGVLTSRIRRCCTTSADTQTRPRGQASPQRSKCPQ